MDEKAEIRTTTENAEEKRNRRTILLHDMVRGARKYWWVLAVIIAACAGIGLLAGVRAFRPMYKAEATFTVKTQDVNGSYNFYYDN